MPAQYYETVAIHGNISGIDAPVAFSGNITAAMSGNVAGITAPVSISGNIAGITAPVAFSGNVSAVLAGNIAGITAPVGIYGNIAGITANIRGIDATVDVSNFNNSDSMGRTRTSGPFTIIQSVSIGNIYDFQMTTSNSGSGAVVYNANTMSTRLSVGTGLGTAVRQTKTRCVCPSGKTVCLYQSFVMAPPQSNLTQQVGYFDTKNGVFLRVSNNETSFVRRSFVTGSVSEEVVPRSSWNVDMLDGMGPTGITANLQLSQILVEDFAFLGAGWARCGFFIDGRIRFAHMFKGANNLRTSFVSNPNLPVRWENYCSGAITGVSNLESITCSLTVEGGQDTFGLLVSTDSGNVASSFTTGQTKEILGIRIGSGFTEFATAYLQSACIMCNSTSSFRWRIVYNPVVTGAGTWAPVESFRSVVEKNTTRTVTPGTGVIVASGFQNQKSDTILLSGQLSLVGGGTLLDGTTDTVSLQATPLSNQAEEFFARVGWREVS